MGESLPVCTKTETYELRRKSVSLAVKKLVFQFYTLSKKKNFKLIQPDKQLIF